MTFCIGGAAKASIASVNELNSHEFEALYLAKM